MQNQPQVSLSVLNQLPDFIKEEFPKFEKFLSAYYGSVERGGGPVGILNNLDSYFNLSKTFGEFFIRGITKSGNFNGSSKKM